MGAEFFTKIIKAENECEVSKKYEDILSDLEFEQARIEADCLLNDTDYIPDAECQPDWVVELKTQALEDYSEGRIESAINNLADYLIALDYETIYTYTGTFLSADSGLHFLETKNEKGDPNLKEFMSVGAARDYIYNHHEKWDEPMVAKIKDSDKWVIGAWCSS